MTVDETDLCDYVVQHSGLSAEVVLKVLDLELQYLKLIGIAEEVD